MGQMGRKSISRIVLLKGILFALLLVSLDSIGSVPGNNKFRKSRLTYDEAEGTADRRHLLLTTGEDKTIDLDFETDASKIFYGNQQVVTSTLVKIGDKRQVVFKPLKAGETNVTIRDNDGTLRLIFMIRVTGSNLLRIAGEIRSLLRDVEGVEIRIVGPKVVIEGEILVPADYGRILGVIQDRSYADFVLNLAYLSPVAMQALAKRIQDDIAAFAPDVTVRVVNGMIFLEGTVPTIEQADRAVRVADLYLPDLRPGPLLEKDPAVLRHPPRQMINNFIVVVPAPPKKQEKLIRITVHFVELAKNYNKVFNFKWQPAYTEVSQINVGQQANGSIGTSGATPTGAQNGFSLSATITSLIPKLDSIQAAGYGRILKTGTIVVRSGQPATLYEGTSIPGVSTSSSGQAVASSTDVGLTVSVTPVILGRSDDIQMNLKVDQTNVIGKSPVAGGPPTTAKHKVDTDIYIRSNESAAVASVSSSTIGSSFNTDPPYNGSYEPKGSTDALFTLMRSKSYNKQKAQFVIFVTPQIVENASEGTEDLKKNFRVKVK